MQKRVVITGMGIYSCLGKTLDEVRESLYTGKSGIVFDPERKELGFRSALTAKLDIPDLKKELSRAQRVYMPEQAKYAYCATVDALRDAKIDQDFLNKYDVGLIYGNDTAMTTTSMLMIRGFCGSAARKISSPPSSTATTAAQDRRRILNTSLKTF